MKSIIALSAFTLLFVLTTVYGQSCEAGYFQCPNSGRCISEGWLCDGDNDCGDMSDENRTTCLNWQCQPDKFKCNTTGRCIPIGYVCDDDVDCADGSDEIECPCPIPGQVKCPKGECILPEMWCDADGICDCTDCVDQNTNCTMLHGQEVMDVETLLQQNLLLRQKISRIENKKHH